MQGLLQLRENSLRTTPFYAKKTDIEQALTVSYAGERKFQKLTKKKTTLLTMALQSGIGLSRILILAGAGN